MPTAPLSDARRRPRASQVTRDRILDAAERLFLDHGYDGTSSRMITAAARVNLAAVNYHFGGKEGLFQAMLARRLDALHEERLALLDGRRARRPPAGRSRASGSSPRSSSPRSRLARDARRGGADFLRLLGRAYVDPSPALRAFLSERYAPSIARFKDAFARALPHIAPRELAWRLHFMMGALAYTLAGADAWKLIAALNPTETGNDQLLLRAPRAVPDRRAAGAAARPHARGPGRRARAQPSGPRPARDEQDRGRPAVIPVRGPSRARRVDFAGQSP